MMNDWLLSSMATGATIVLFDGSPFLPTETILWDLVDQLKFNIYLIKL